MLLFSLPMIQNTSLYYIIGHESLNKTSRRKSSMWWSFDTLFCSAGRLVYVCVYAWFCMSANTQRVCGSCTYRSVTDSWWEFSDSRSRCWPLFQRKTSKRRHWRLMGLRLIRPTLIPIITFSKLSSDSHLSPPVLCRQSPSLKGDLCGELRAYLLDWFWFGACEVCRCGSVNLSPVANSTWICLQIFLDMIHVICF